MKMTPVVQQLLILNIIFFVGSMFLVNSTELFALYFYEGSGFQPWQIITHMFMHGGIMHIAFNMFALYSFGSTLESLWGGKKFLFFYISCGLGSAILHTAVTYFQIHNLLDSIVGLNLSAADIRVLLKADFSTLFDENGRMIEGEIRNMLSRANINQEQYNLIAQANYMALIPVLGASGAIYGLLVAFAFQFPEARLGLMFIPIPIKAKYFVIGLLSVDLFLGFSGKSLFGTSGTGIAHFAHIGGALVGFIMVYYWKKNQFDKNRWN
jgi:membrane associated rhomboid family serine protease